MEYRGVEYRVVQTIDGDFRWSAQLGGREKFGIHRQRDEAIEFAKKLIDQDAQKRAAVGKVGNRRAAG